MNPSGFIPNFPPPRPANSQHEGMNAPDRFESFILGDGEQKITMKIDTRTPNTSIFTINKEDHTLANLLRAELCKDPILIPFCAYKVPHPLFAAFELRIQTNGTITPKQAVVRACRAIIQQLKHLDMAFTTEFAIRQRVNGEASEN